MTRSTAFFRLSRAMTAVISLAFISVGCSYERSQTSKEARQAMVGMSKAQILACAGTPRTIVHDGDAELLTYSIATRDADLLLGRAPTYAEQVTGTARPRDCRVTFLIRDNVVQSVSYRGNTGGLLTQGDACYPIIRHCLPGAE